jgi:hypothetical protein
MFILVHGGDKHDDSTRIRNYIKKEGVNGIIELSTESEEVYTYLKHIKIKYIPSLIIKKGESITQKKATIDNVRAIINELREIFYHDIV